MPFLYEHQEKALEKMKNGCILCGDVGSGKSRTAIAYYFSKVCGGLYNGTDYGYETDYIPMNEPRDLYIITTAKKRDLHEWQADLSPFLLSTNPDASLYGTDVKVTVDSWNNITKYKKIYGAFFIFDEQRLVGSGAWVKAFYQIAKKNQWILLSATPGDTWKDYIPVFVANGFYKNRTEFNARHAVYNPYTKFQKIERYVEEARLERLKQSIQIPMPVKRDTTRHYKTIIVEYNKILFKDVMTNRVSPFTGKPIENVSEYGYALRRIVNSDPSRADAILELCKDHPKVIIFYGFNYELDILKSLDYYGATVAEWNGKAHEEIPKTDKWVYLVQYKAGCEGWNCIETDTIIFYSLDYSYRTMHQASGRIDRLNTPFKDLYYYRLKSNSWIDMAISRALAQKKNFNIRNYVS